MWITSSGWVVIQSFVDSGRGPREESRDGATRVRKRGKLKGMDGKEGRVSDYMRMGGRKKDLHVGSCGGPVETAAQPLLPVESRILTACLQVPEGLDVYSLF